MQNQNRSPLQRNNNQRGVFFGENFALISYWFSELNTRTWSPSQIRRLVWWVEIGGPSTPQGGVGFRRRKLSKNFKPPETEEKAETLPKMGLIIWRFSKGFQFRKFPTTIWFTVMMSYAVKNQPKMAKIILKDGECSKIGGKNTKTRERDKNIRRCCCCCRDRPTVRTPAKRKKQNTKTRTGK